MGRYLIRLNGGAHGHYLEWSTIVDAPVSAAMTRGQLLRWHAEKYGSRGQLAERLQRLDAYGTNARLHSDVTETVWLNRAGPGESQLSMRGLVLAYVYDWSDARLASFIVRELGAEDDAAPYHDSYQRWADHDNRRRASCGRWP